MSVSPRPQGSQPLKKRSNQIRTPPLGSLMTCPSIATPGGYGGRLAGGFAGVSRITGRQLWATVEEASRSGIIPASQKLIWTTRAPDTNALPTPTPRPVRTDLMRVGSSKSIPQSYTGRKCVAYRRGNRGALWRIEGRRKPEPKKRIAGLMIRPTSAFPEFLALLRTFSGSGEALAPFIQHSLFRIRHSRPLTVAKGRAKPLALRHSVSRRTASRYFAAVFATISAGSSGPGGVLSHFPACTRVVR